jgi:hypothetical protein
MEGSSPRRSEHRRDYAIIGGSLMLTYVTTDVFTFAHEATFSPPRWPAP